MLELLYLLCQGDFSLPRKSRSQAGESGAGIRNREGGNQTNMLASAISVSAPSVPPKMRREYRSSLHHRDNYTSARYSRTLRIVKRQADSEHREISCHLVFRHTNRWHAKADNTIEWLKLGNERAMRRPAKINFERPENVSGSVVVITGSTAAPRPTDSLAANLWAGEHRPQSWRPVVG
jgi:hypothetical protein